MSRAAVWSLLTGDSAIQGMGFTTDNMYGNNVTDREKRGGAFLVCAWGEVGPQDRLPGELDIQVQELKVWVHEMKYDSNDFGMINQTLERVKAVLTEALHVPGADGRILSHADWRGDSADLTDDILNTITRNSTFRVVSRRNANAPG